MWTSPSLEALCGIFGVDGWERHLVRKDSSTEVSEVVYNRTTQHHYLPIMDKSCELVRLVASLDFMPPSEDTGLGRCYDEVAALKLISCA